MEHKWWARLTETKRKDLRQLLRDERYALAFDALLDWPGLWTTIKLGSLHRLLCLKCDEVCSSERSVFLCHSPCARRSSGISITFPWYGEV